MNTFNASSKINLVNINEYTLNLLQALREYKERQADKSKVKKLGRYLRTDSGDFEWIPLAKEISRCCTSIYGNKIQGRNLQQHFNSATHIATLYNVTRTDLIRIAFAHDHMQLSDKSDRNSAIAILINASL